MTKCIHCDATVLTSAESVEALTDMQTHYASWRRALQLARAMAAPSGVDHDDAAFWDHEIAVFDSAAPGGFAPRSRTFDTPAVGGEREALQKAIDSAFSENGLYIDWQLRNAVVDKIIATCPPAAQPASPLRVQETCLECGTCDPCDDDCPNYIEANLPASPLRGRLAIAKIIDPDAKWGEVIEAGCDDDHQILLALEKADEILSAAPPEQPATSDTVKMFVEAIDAKNARIAQLEEALGKAVLSDQETT